LNKESIDTPNKSIKKTKKENRLMLIMVSFLILAIAIAYTIPMIRNPMRRPSSMPTNYVLSLTPLGTHIDDVISIVENHRDWIVERTDREQGFVHPAPHTIRPLSEGWPVVVGDKSIRVRSEPYRPFGLLTRTVVAVHYGFDADGYLIEVYVWRSSSV